MQRQNALLCIAVFSCILSSSRTAADTDIPSRERAAQIAEWLTDRPAGVGIPAADRAVWDPLAKHPDWRRVVPEAEKLLDQSMPVLNDELYLEFSQNGSRTAYERDYFQLERRLNTLVLAECLENKGRFLPAIDACLQQYIHCRSWVYPAHDGNLETFHGKRPIVDLGSSRMAFNLATAYDLLDDKLISETRTQLRETIFTRVLNPMKEQFTGGQKKEWWVNTTNNWNAVCLANVTGAAVTMIEDKNERGFYIAAAEHYINNFLNGFNDDGYCTEGPGYWNYGYGKFIILCKIVEAATGGQLDLFDSEKARRPAFFGWDIQLVPGLTPAFADCSINTRPSLEILEETARRLNTPKRYRTSHIVSPSQSLFSVMLYNQPRPDDSPELPAPTLPMRSWFDKTGVLICRPQPGTTGRLAAAFKGGHNNEHHNHNDLGSFVVAIDGRLLLLDPGSEVYTKFTFSSQRYKSDANNSFGHPVPVIAGQLQKTGAAAKAEMIDTEFTDTADRLTFDLTRAYDVASLQKITRQFVYSREYTGVLTIVDNVVFSEPNTFETALVTYADIKQVDERSLLIADDKTAVRVQIDANEAPFTVRIEPLTANFRGGKPRRIGIKLDDPVAEAAVRITITPE